MQAAVIVFPGSNCDRDVAVALKAAIGHAPLMVWHRETVLPAVDLVVVPGGFSYGDYLRCGAMAAHSPIMREVKARAEGGLPVLGICNGFQILTEAGMLPGVLMRNRGLKFICRDVHLRVESTESPFTARYRAGEVVRFPIAHAEGNYFADTATLDRLEGEGRVAFRYASAEGVVDDSVNPNGAARNIAGIFSENRRILGLMPHPERLAEALLGGADGALMFDSLVETLRWTESPITPETIRAHGLTESEYGLVLKILGRTPNITELGIFSVMWSEHCSYKSSKKWLKTLPTEAPWVICGPGENAGVIDIGDGMAAIFKMESHNHPSFIEPYQGAATGVGGILRDVFTMGARPVANLNVLRFGEPSHPKTRHLVNGVVAGVGGYGNCVGVPTVGGETNFHASYNGNNLVNAMTVGVARTDRIFYSAAAGVGNPVVYVGSKTGRDGIHGATMASAEFGEGSEEKRPTVQVGDPFTEKLLIEACLELMATECIVAIQDMGAAGLTSSSFEMASKGGLGIEMDLDAVPMRESAMTAYEIMLSESQERMLLVLKPGHEDEARAIFTKWELDFAIVGHLTDTGRMVLKRHGAVVADLPIDPLAQASPEYERPWVAPAKRPVVELASVPATDTLEALKTLIACPDLASKRWIWEQYDHMVMGDTVARPGGDAAIVRLHGTNKALAITTDCTPRYVAADPREGARQAVAESYRNLCAVGALPLALTDNLNFGNPEKPEVMGQIVESIRGLGEACRSLDVPVVSGNVSLYNETNGQPIQPTPAIGTVGLIEDLSKTASLPFKEAGDAILLIGETRGWLGASLYLREVLGREDGAPPPVALHREKREGTFVRAMIGDGYLTAVHDVSDGGLLVAITEMAMASGIGATLDVPRNIAAHGWWFGEDQGRYVLTMRQDNVPAVLEAASRADVTIQVIGSTGGDDLTLKGGGAISVEALRTLNEAWLPGFMAGPDSND